MIIYVLRGDKSVEIEGVFSTEEKAEEAMERLPKPLRRNLFIEPFEIDVFFDWDFKANRAEKIDLSIPSV